jgi:NitT/TauT family transport system permease protein
MTRRAHRPVKKAWIRFVQLAILAAFILTWQYLPDVKSLSSHYHFLDPIFISSPSAVAQQFYNQTTGAGGTTTIWSYVAPTMEAAVIGLAIGVVAGLAAGLLLANSVTLNRIFRPFLIALNAVPRIALIPVFLLIFGLSVRGTTAVCVAVVFFVAFFNAYEGGSSVPSEVLDTVGLLGARRWQLVSRVRLPYAAAWTFAALPLAITFSIISVVTAEVLIGTRGLGRLLLISLQNGDSTETFTVTVLLSVLGLVAVGGTELAKRRVLHWWGRT